MPKKTDDIDAELLNLTGHSGGVQKKQARKPVVPLKKRFMSAMSGGDSSASALATPKAQPTYYESSEDEGSSDSWAGSASEEEDDDDFSDSESSSDEEVNMEGLSEVQREQLALAQFEKKERKRQRREFKMQARARKQSKKQLRSRKKAAPSQKDNAFTHLKKKRLQQAMKSDAVDGESSEDEEDEEMVDAFDGGAEYGEYEESERPVVLEDIHSVQVTRTQIEKYHNRSVFRKNIIGLYTRVALELRGEERVYRVYEIVGVKEGNRWYTIDKLKLKTNLVLTLKYGTSQRDFLMKYISNNPFQQSEFERWIMTLKGAHTPPPTLEYIRRLQEQKHEMDTYRLTHEEINEITKRNKEHMQMDVSAAAEKQRLYVEIAKAERSGDPELLKEAEQRLEDVHRRMNKKIKAVTKYTESIDQINKAIREKNEERIARASQHNQVDDTQGETDPFSRRKTEQTLIFTKPEEAADESEARARKLADKQRRMHKTAADKVAAILRDEDAPISTVVPDVAADHDFEVNIDIDKLGAAPQSLSLGRSQTPKAKPTTAKAAKVGKRLSLSDYRKRRAV